jgi:hypothetical protein
MFVARTVLPLPPLGENTVTTVPESGTSPFALAAFCKAKSNVSIGWGSTITSAAPISSPASTMPFGSP